MSGSPWSYKFVLLLTLAVIISCSADKFDQLYTEIDEHADSEPDGSSGCTKDYEVDHILLAITWTPGFFVTSKVGHSISKVKEPKLGFTVHGLWPQIRNQRSQIDCCSKEVFDLRVLRPLDPNLRTYWTALNGMSPEGFWSFEWQKHGKCADRIQGINTLFRYFEFVVRNMQRLHLIETLAEADIVPSDEDSYSGAKIVSVLSEQLKSKVSINCASVRESPMKNALTQVNVCFSTDLKQINCPFTKRRCLGEIMFPKTAS